MRRKLKTNRVGAVQIASNMYIAQKHGTVLLYSYETPVAGEDFNGKFRTDKFYSTTTSKHINKWLGGKDVGRVVPQDEIYQRAVIVNCM